jgi:acyl-[acyl-carrier-protein]-phospholipid O-acyltransferase/long-chain-fatty-acid--[acyl-carrier-protein] ligase
VEQRVNEKGILIKTFISRCKQRRFRPKIADSTGQELTGGSLLMRTLILRRLLRREVLSDDETHVGLLLPPTAGGVIANAALTLDRRVAVNLNYTVSSQVMNACIDLAGIKHVLTSRKVMEKMNLELDTDVVYLEDLREKLRLSDKLIAACQSYVVPAATLSRSLGADGVEPSDVLTVIFTSGSTGTPKGVMLTNANIVSQVAAIDHAIHLTSNDVILGILPFFHSMGYTVTFWTAMCLDVKGVYHFNPLDPKQVGKLAGKHRATILLSTPTFLRSYLRRCDKEQFEALDVVVTGAEKLPSSLASAFEEKFGVRPVEGYGTTELSPLVSVNIPPSRSSDDDEVDYKEGTVGRAVLGVSVKAVDLETGEDLPAGQSGMLLVSGANVMKGYMGREDLTAEVIKDGWYVTGDVGFVAEDGFVTITGRESRFSKIGGEMVPHIKVEDELNALLNALIESDEDDGPKLVVTAVPDAKKGERLIVIHTKIDKSADALRSGLSDAGLPNIYIPSSDSFLQVEELPMLGTGKLDLRAVKQMAIDTFGGAEAG